MSDDTRTGRREFLQTAAMILTASRLGAIGEAATSAGTSRSTPAPGSMQGAHMSLESPKQSDAGVLNVGYAEAGPGDGPAVILLHGWPYDIHSYVDVGPALAGGASGGSCRISAATAAHDSLPARHAGTAGSLRSRSTSSR